MRLLACNGSPRGARSNTDLLLDAFLAGFRSGGGEVEARLHLVRPSHRDEAARRFADAEAVLLAFPLYADHLPAPAKAFVEALAPYVGRDRNPALLFLVQSGFPEACHSRPVQRWLERLAARLGARCLGTIVKGGVEGIQARPPWMRRPLLRRLERLGRGVARDGRLDPAELAALAGRERLRLDGPGARIALAISARLSEGFWNAQLRANGALADRDARPLAAEDRLP